MRVSDDFRELNIWDFHEIIAFDFKEEDVTLELSMYLKGEMKKATLVISMLKRILTFTPHQEDFHPIEIVVNPIYRRKRGIKWSFLCPSCGSRRFVLYIDGLTLGCAGCLNVKPGAWRKRRSKFAQMLKQAFPKGREVAWQKRKLLGL